MQNDISIDKLHRFDPAKNLYAEVIDMTEPVELTVAIRNTLIAIGADIVGFGDISELLALRGFGGGVTICGKCIEVCPHTRRYIGTE
jgi:ferredoxin